MKPLRPHQQTSIDLLREALRSGSKRPMLQLPTGAGKTRVASEIINLSLAKGNRVTFCVPAISLVDQTAREFWDEGIRDVGVMQANHDQTHPDRPVQIASIQTLARREIPSAGLVIIDEAHRRSSFVTTWMGMPEWSSVPFIGLSATPWAKGLGQLYDKLIIGSTTAELIEAGYLSPFTVFAPSHPDLSGVRTVAGEYHEGDLAKAMAPLVGDVVTTWLQKGEGRPTLCFAVDCAHARQLQEQFQDAGVACGYIDAHTSSDERETVRKQFANRDLQVVTSVGCLTTGVDWDVRCIVLARPTKSEMLFVQMVGRGLRTAAGKQECLILDHTDTTMKLGFVTDIHHSRLDGGKLETGDSGGADEPKPQPPRECKKCSRLLVKGDTACPSCGYKPERASAGVDWVEGELIQLSSAKKANAEDWHVKISFIRQLRAYALERGYKPGWVNYKYLEKYGVKPWDRRLADATPAPGVSPEVRSWIKSRDIARIKGMQKRGASPELRP